MAKKKTNEEKRPTSEVLAAKNLSDRARNNIEVERSRGQTTFEKSLIRNFITPLHAASRQLSPFGNAADFRRIHVTETEDTITVTTDVAGTDPDTLQIDLHDDHLHIQGSIDHVFNAGHPYRYTATHDEFDRLVELPAAVDSDHIRAEYEDGILTVRMRKLARDIEA